MAHDTSMIDKGLRAALELAAEKPWASLTLGEIALRADLTLNDFHGIATRETLADVEGPIDMLVLDGWKSMYLPVHDLLRPRLAPGCLIVADNIDHEAAADYLAFLRGPDSGMMTTVIGDLALSYVVQ